MGINHIQQVHYWEQLHILVHLQPANPGLW
jgi:hypothetical protein